MVKSDIITTLMRKKALKKSILHRYGQKLLKHTID